MRNVAAPPLSRLTASPREVASIMGIGLTSVYVLINDGVLESVKIGNRRLIKLQSVYRLIGSSEAVTA